MVAIDKLLTVNFRKRTKEEQEQIIEEGRPRPQLRRFVAGKDGILKSFNVSIYDKENWLCGCDKRHALFCWTCLLFAREKSHWNSSGFYEFNTLNEQIGKHKFTQYHIHGMLRYHKFLKQNMPSTTNSSGAIQRNVTIKKKYEILRRIIDVVCVLVSQTPLPHKRANKRNLLKPTDCTKLLTLMKMYDDRDIVNEAIKLIQNCPKVAADIVNAMANLVKQAIRKETKFSTFVSLVLSEHAGIGLRSKLSTVVRYVKDGQIHERLLGFTNLDMEKTSPVVQEHIAKVVSDLEVSNKFLSISTDGSVPLAKYTYHFLKWLRKYYPKTLYVPCHFHDFNFVLQQTVSEFPECLHFFKNLKSIRTYFESNSEICKAFHTFSGERVPDLSNLKLTNSQFIRVLKMHRQSFVQFFKSLANGCQEWSNEEIVKAIGFQRALENYQTLFLLEMFFLLFDHTTFLSEILNSSSPNGVFEKEVLDDVIASLRHIKENDFEQLWTLVIAEVIEDYKPDMLKASGEEEIQQLFQLFYKVVDRILQVIQLRFACARKLNFLSILDCENREKFITSDYHLGNLATWKSPFFDEYQLEIEMDILSKYGWVTGRKSVSELVEFLRRKNLHVTFKSVYKLAEFIVTLPCKPTCPTNSSEKFESINAWASFSETPEMDCFSLLRIEYELLEYLRSQIQFYDEVILKLNATLEPMFSDSLKKTSENLS